MPPCPGPIGSAAGSRCRREIRYPGIAGVPPATAGTAAVPKRLFVRHDPDAVPILGRRVVLIIAAAVDEDLRGLVAWRGFERVTEMPDRGEPVAPLITF